MTKKGARVYLTISGQRQMRWAREATNRKLSPVVPLTSKGGNH